MGGIRDGLLGTQAKSGTGGAGTGGLEVFGGGDPPGVLGTDDPEPIPLDSTRVIARVTKDWDPPNPTTTPEITVPKTMSFRTVPSFDMRASCGLEMRALYVARDAEFNAG